MTTPQAHTKEPWKVSNYRPAQIIARNPSESTYEKGDNLFEPLAVVSTGNGFADLANAVRIVQCVNALAGIQDPAAAIAAAREALVTALPHYKLAALMGDTDSQAIAQKIMDALTLLKGGQP